MQKKYSLRRLFIVAFAMVALYATKIGRIGLGVEVDPIPTIGEIPAPENKYRVDEVPLVKPETQPEMKAVIPNEPSHATDVSKDEAAAIASGDITGELEKDPAKLPGEMSPGQETLEIYGRKPKRQAKSEARDKIPKDIEAAVAKEDTFDPTAAIADWYNEGAGRVRRSIVEIMGVKIDLAEIDLIVETEVLAGTIRTKEEIIDYRRYVIGQKVVEKRAALAQQLDRSRSPSSVKKSSL